MTLIRFELKKIFGSKFLLAALCLLLVLNLLLLSGVQEFAEIKSQTAENMSFQQFLAGGRQVTDAMRTQYGAFGDQNDVMKNRNDSIQSSLESVVRSARTYGREALESGDDYGVRRNLKIIELYSKPRGKASCPIRGWTIYLFDSPTMLLVFLLLLLVCAGSVAGENDRRTWLLLHTSKNGKRKTLAAKYMAGGLTAAVLTILFQAVSLFGVWLQSGLLGSSQPISVTDELMLCPYPLTVGQYALVSLLCQIVSAVMLSVLLVTVSALSRSTAISYGIGAVLLGGCVLLADYSSSEWLKGPLALARPDRYFDGYVTGNILGFPVPWAVIQTMLWSILGAGCVVLANKVYHRKRRAI